MPLAPPLAPMKSVPQVMTPRTDLASAPPDFTSAREEFEKALIAAPLGRDELRTIVGNRWSGPETQSAVDAALSQYLASTADAEKRLRRPLSARLDAAYAWDPARAAFDPAPGPELVAFERERAAWNVALDDAEQVLLRYLEGIAPSDDGAPIGRTRARIAGTRDRRPLSDSVARLDLDEMLSSLEVPEAPMLRSSPEVDTWRVSREKALRIRRIELDRLQVRRAEALTALGPFDLSEEDPRRLACDRDLAVVEREEAATEVPLAVLHRATINRLRSVLSPASAAALDMVVIAETSPELLESERSLRQLAEAMLADPDMTRETRDSLAAIAGQLDARVAVPREALLKSVAARELAAGQALLHQRRAAQINALEREVDFLARRVAHRRALLSFVRDLKRFVPPSNEAALDRVQQRILSLEALDRQDVWTTAAALAEIERIRRGPDLPFAAPSAPNEPTTADAPASTPAESLETNR